MNRTLRNTIGATIAVAIVTITVTAALQLWPASALGERGGAPGGFPQAGTAGQRVAPPSRATNGTKPTGGDANFSAANGSGEGGPGGTGFRGHEGGRGGASAARAIPRVMQTLAMLALIGGVAALVEARVLRARPRPAPVPTL